MMSDIKQFEKVESRRDGGERISPIDNRQAADRWVDILRILLLANRSNPYTMRQDIRGILMDSYS
jgi:hypothetical protein